MFYKNLYKRTRKTCSGLCRCPQAGARSRLDAEDPPLRMRHRSHETLSAAHLGLRQPSTCACRDILRDWAPGHQTHRQTTCPEPSCSCHALTAASPGRTTSLRVSRCAGMRSCRLGIMRVSSSKSRGAGQAGGSESTSILKCVFWCSFIGF